MAFPSSQCTLIKQRSCSPYPSNCFSPYTTFPVFHFQTTISIQHRSNPCHPLERPKFLQRQLTGAPPSPPRRLKTRATRMQERGGISSLNSISSRAMELLPRSIHGHFTNVQINRSGVAGTRKSKPNCLQSRTSRTFA